MARLRHVPGVKQLVKWKNQDLNPDQPGSKACVLSLPVAKGVLGTHGKRLPESITSRWEPLTNLWKRSTSTVTNSYKCLNS